MIAFLNSIALALNLSNLLSPLRNKLRKGTILYWLTITVSLLASLEFGQDYIRSVLNSSPFSITQSLAYKLFWVAFIPFTCLFLHLQHTNYLNDSKRKLLLKKALLIVVITLVHLLVFSLLLHLSSFTISENPWPLASLITKKLSTRLYLALSFYLVFTFIYQHVENQPLLTSNGVKRSQDTLLIKNGSKTTLLETQKINAIVSDGPYLEINTLDHKYILLDSLKNIITSLPDNFRRIHKSTIVNIDQIVSSKSRGNGDYDLILKGGEMVRLSRNYAKPLKGILL